MGSHQRQVASFIFVGGNYQSGTGSQLNGADGLPVPAASSQAVNSFSANLHTQDKHDLTSPGMCHSDPPKLAPKKIQFFTTIPLNVGLQF